MSLAEVANSRKSSALFASSQFLLGRVALSALIAFAAIVLGCRNWPLGFFVLLVGSVLAQLSLSRADGVLTGENGRLLLWGRAALSFFDTSMYSAAAVAMAQTSTGLAGAFAMLILMVTIVYVLMHFYMQPRLVLILNTPCFLGLIFCLGGRDLVDGALRDPYRTALPFLGAAFMLFFLSGARVQLARARLALVKSRVEAQDRAREAVAASRSKSDFLATMGHEIRTPLNGVLGIAQVMSRGELSADQRTQLDIIRESGETLLIILNDLLDISKIEAGKVELECAPFSMRALATGVHATFSGAASAKDITFKLCIDAGADGLYAGDQARLRQILYNLVSNAVKFTARGEVVVTIARSEYGLSVSVKDTGIGVPASRREALFEKFVQADTSTTRRYGGTGLGLSIVSQLVELMGGKLTLDSIEGKGSTFNIILPLTRLGDECEAPSPVVKEASEQVAQTDIPLRVLVAEDNPTNQIVIKMMLAQAGVEPTIVGNGRLAVEAWETQIWDVILMDVQMPEMDGLAATNIIREHECHQGRRRTPILALTANAMTHQRVEYMAKGMDDLISKPINASALFEALDRALTDETQAENEVAA